MLSVFIVSSTFFVPELHMSDLTLLPGIRYYSSLTVCNSAGQCTEKVSDGVMPLISPPRAGVLQNGLGPEHSSYTTHRLVKNEQDFYKYIKYIYSR